MSDNLSLFDLISIAAAAVELLIAAVWRMPAAVVADWLDLAAGRGGATVGGVIVADGSAIEWTEATWNVITGCSVVSPGCSSCYAMLLLKKKVRVIR